MQSTDNAQAARTPALTKGTVLVIDDEPLVARVMQRALESSYTVRMAEAALEGLRLLEREPIDIVLLDITLPGLTGLDLCERIKSDVLLRHTPIILVTGLGSLEDKIRGLQMGADDYLSKPFSIDELKARVEAAIRKSRLSLEANPLSKLPGNGSIEREILKRINTREIFSVLYADLNEFKAYNDYYGFHRGDEVIRATARLLLETAGNSKNLVAHVGGDDFIVVVKEAQPTMLCEKIIREFDEIVPTFYDAADRNAGVIKVKDRLGDVRSFALLSIAIGVVTNSVRPITCVGEVAAIGAEVKGVAKRQKGSAYFIDRRQGAYLLEQLNAMKETKKS